MTMRTGRIMNICRLRREIDGAGIRTLVLMHGCNLHCKYCLNNYCHDMSADVYNLTVEELRKIFEIDDAYFRMSGGGITFGGGEPLLQAEYIRDFAVHTPCEWSICIETSLNIPWKEVELLLPFVDKWIIDVKDLSPSVYAAYTGRNNSLVLDNLEKFYMNAGDSQISIWVPIIQGYNIREDVEKSLIWLDKYSCDKEVFSYVIPVL